MRMPPPELLAKKPPPLFCIARDRESGTIQIFQKFEPMLDGASSMFRKRTYQWWMSHYWTHRDLWRSHSPYQVEREVKSRAYWTDYMEIKAESEEKAIEQYKLKTRN